MRTIAALRLALFVAALCLPMSMTGRGGPVLTSEQRVRAPRPALHAAGWQYPEQFDAYVRDNFGWRDRLVGWHHVLKYRYLHESPVDPVIVGRDGWLFYTGEGMDIRNFAGRWPHSPSDVEAWLARQEARAHEYAALGSQYLIVIAPDKQSLYPEFVPDRYGPPAPGVLGEVLQGLAAHPALKILDLRPVLRAHAETPVYLKTDTHWNALGASIAARAIVQALRPALPTIGTIDPSVYVGPAERFETGDLGQMLGPGIHVTEVAPGYTHRTLASRLIVNKPGNTVWTQPASRMPRAVLLGDSFGAVLDRMLCDAFSRLRYFMSTLNGPDPSIVREERPDVVVLILVERHLPRLAEQ